MAALGGVVAFAEGDEVVLFEPGFEVFYYLAAGFFVFYYAFGHLVGLGFELGFEHG